MKANPVTFFLVVISIAFSGCDEKMEEPVSVPAMAAKVESPPVVTALSEQLKQDEYMVSLRVEQLGSIKVGSHVDVLSVFRDPKLDQPTGQTIFQNIVVAAINQDSAPREVSFRFASEKLARKAVFADGSTAIGLVLREENDARVEKDFARITTKTIKGGTRYTGLQKIRDRLSSSASGKSDKFRSMTLPTRGAWMAKAGDCVSILCTFFDPQAGYQVTFPLGEGFEVLKTYPQQVSLAVLPQEAELLFFGSQVGVLHLVLDGKSEDKPAFSKERTCLESYQDGRRRVWRGSRRIQIIKIKPSGDSSVVEY